MIKKQSVFLLMAILGMLFNACKKEVLPVADFVYTIDGLSVSFENRSSEASSYLWNFGDGKVTSETNPSHLFTTAGIHSVSLKAINDDGEDYKFEDINLSKPVISIDGNVDDWVEYDSYYVGLNGSLLESKVTGINDFIYFYLKARVDAGPIFQVYIDKDNSGSTGWNFWGAYDSPGLDYMLEWVSLAGEEGSAILYTANTEDWPWNNRINEDAMSESSGWVTVGNEKYIEFSVASSLMPGLANTVRMSFLVLNSVLEEQGSLPASWQDPAASLEPIVLF